MEDKLKIGLVGVGHLGTFHLNIIKQIRNAEFIGFFEADQEKAKKIESEYNIKSYPSYEE